MKKRKAVWMSQRASNPKQKAKFSSVQSLSHVRLFATPWTVVYQAPLSVGISRQENWSGLPFPSSGDLPNPGTEHKPPACLFLIDLGSFAQRENVKTVKIHHHVKPAMKLKYYSESLTMYI